MVEIVNAISEVFGHMLSVVFTDDNAEKLVLRIRALNEAKNNNTMDDDADDDAEGFLRRIEKSLLSELKLRGVAGVTKVYMREDNVAQLGADGKTMRSEWILDTEVCRSKNCGVLAHLGVHVCRASICWRFSRSRKSIIDARTRRRSPRRWTCSALKHAARRCWAK